MLFNFIEALYKLLQIFPNIVDKLADSVTKPEDSEAVAAGTNEVDAQADTAVTVPTTPGDERTAPVGEERTNRETGGRREGEPITWKSIQQSHREHLKRLKNLSRPYRVLVTIILLYAAYILIRQLLDLEAIYQQKENAFSNGIWFFLRENISWFRFTVALLVILIIYLGWEWIHYLRGTTLRSFSYIRSHPLRFTVLLFFIILLFVSDGRIVILPFQLGNIETSSLNNGEAIANQLVTELNQVGVGSPAPALNLLKLGEPDILIKDKDDNELVIRVSEIQDEVQNGNENEAEMPFEPDNDACDRVLLGPEFIHQPNQSITYPRGRFGTQEERLDLAGAIGGVSAGSVNLPTQLFTELVLKVFPINYREITGNLTEHDNELEISVNITARRGFSLLRESQPSDPEQTWRVSGPSSAYPEMMEFLAIRIILYLQPNLVEKLKEGGAPDLDDWRLAFALGNEAYRHQEFGRARSFYEIADRLDKEELPDIDMMRALSMYQLSQDDPESLGEVLDAISIAVFEDKDETHRALLRPYLGCIWLKSDDPHKAQEQFAAFITFLNAQSEIEKAIAIQDVLAALPVRGPGRRVDVESVDTWAYIRTGNQLVFKNNNSIRPFQLNAAPRQIRLWSSGNQNYLYYVSTMGEVWFRDLASKNPNTDKLISLKDIVGVQQIAIIGRDDAQSVAGNSQNNEETATLVFLSKSGKVYKCTLLERNRCTPQLLFNTDQGATESLQSDPSLTNVRQITVVANKIYLLTADGAVWEVSDLDEPIPRNLINSAAIQEIFVLNRGEKTIIYLLHENGTVSRYLDDGEEQTEDLVLIFEIIDTAQIFACNDDLYLLRPGGVVWRLDNAATEVPLNKYVEFNLHGIDTKTPIRELFLVCGEDDNSEVKMYLRTGETEWNLNLATFTEDNLSRDSLDREEIFFRNLYESSSEGSG